MTNILFVVSHLYPQGPNKQLLYLCRNINLFFFNPVIITTSQNDFEGSLHTEFQKAKIKVFDLKLSKLKSIISGRKEIQKIIESKNINIIVSYGFRSDFISSNLKNVVKITSVRNTLLLNWRFTWGPILGRLFGNINFLYIKKFDYVIACSTSVSNYLNKLSLQNIPICNSIDTLDLQKKIIKNNSLVLSEKTSFITISSKLKGKNIEFLIQAFIQPELSNYDLLIAGYVDQKVKIKYEKYPNIKFLGHLNNLHDYLYSSDFFISSSLHEGMPNAVLEALALGTPAILSDIKPHEEILNKQPDTIGVIFKNNSFLSIKNSIEEILKVDYKILSQNCQKAIAENFSVVKMANEYENLFRSVVNEKL